MPWQFDDKNALLRTLRGINEQLKKMAATSKGHWGDCCTLISQYLRKASVAPTF